MRVAVDGFGVDQPWLSDACEHVLVVQITVDDAVLARIVQQFASQTDRLFDEAPGIGALRGSAVRCVPAFDVGL